MTSRNTPRAHSNPLFASAKLFKSMGHPERVRILEVLTRGEQPVASILNTVGGSPSALSRHLSILRSAGIIERRRHHHRVVYRLCHPKTSDLLAIARVLLAESQRGYVETRMLAETSLPSDAP
jgi:DNA-binding transcriptional ArsR family regulator